MARRNQQSVGSIPLAVLSDGSDNGGTGNESITDATSDGDNGSAAITIDPSAIGGGSAASDGDNGGIGEPRKRRGRKPGSRNAPKAIPHNIDAIEALLLGTHTLLASVSRVPELGIEPLEAKQVATAYVNVARHYPILQQSEKVIDWTNLLIALGAVYGSRLYSYRMRKPAQPAAPPRPPTATAASNAEGNNVVQIPGLGTVNPATGERVN